MAPSSYVVEALLLISQVSALFEGPMAPCGSDCSYDESDLRLSCTGLALTCIPKPCCVERTRFVDLSVNNLTTIGPIAFQSFPDLHSLDVRLNSIVSVSRWAFQGLRYLQILDLRENKLTILRSGIFEGLLNMKTLILTKNSIEDIQPGTFRLLPNLKTLRLNHNLLQVIYPDTFAQLPKLVTLDLSANNIHTIYYGSFHTLLNLEFLSLANNKLASLPVFLDFLEELDHLNLKENPLFCDCSLEFVRLWFRGRDSAFKKSGVCSQPGVLKGRVLASVDTQFLCDNLDESMYDSLTNSIETTSPSGKIFNAFDLYTTGTTHPDMTSNRPLSTGVMHEHDASYSTTYVTQKLRKVYSDANEDGLNGTIANGGREVVPTQSQRDFNITKGIVNSRTTDRSLMSSHTPFKTTVSTIPNRGKNLKESKVRNSQINMKSKLFYEKVSKFSGESSEDATEPSDFVTFATSNRSSQFGSTAPEPRLSRERITDTTFLSAHTIKKSLSINRQNIATIDDYQSNGEEDSDSTTQVDSISSLVESQDNYSYDSDGPGMHSSYLKLPQDSSLTPSSSVTLHLTPGTDSIDSGYTKRLNETNVGKHDEKQFLKETNLFTSSRTINSSILAGGSTFRNVVVPGNPYLNMQGRENAPLTGSFGTDTSSTDDQESSVMTPISHASFTDSLTTPDEIFNKNAFITSLENGSVNADLVKFIMMGESVDLECPLSHLAPIHQYLSYYRTKWLSPSGQWIDGSINRYTISRHGSLTVRDVIPSDNGIYRCVRAQYMSDPSIASVELRVSCPCQKIPQMKYMPTTDGFARKQTTLETPLQKMTSSAIPEGNEAHTDQKHCNRVPVAVAVLITFQVTMALCILTFCAYLSWRSSQNRRSATRTEPFLERTRTVSEVNYYDSGEPLNRTSEVPTIVYECTGDEEAQDENNGADSSESDSALSMSGSHRNSAVDSEYVNAQTLTRDRSSTYADLDPHSRSRHDTYSSLHREDEESP